MLERTDFHKTLDTVSALVKVVHWSNDDRDVRIYRVPRVTLNLLQRYLTGGTVPSELHNELAGALSSCPAWADRNPLDLDTTQTGCCCDSCNHGIPRGRNRLRSQFTRELKSPRTRSR